MKKRRAGQTPHGQPHRAGGRGERKTGSAILRRQPKGPIVIVEALIRWMPPVRVTTFVSGVCLAEGGRLGTITESLIGLAESVP
jgi:hypothetical protein